MTQNIQSFLNNFFPYSVISNTLAMENHHARHGISFFETEEQEEDLLFTKRAMGDLLKSIRMSMVLSGGSHLDETLESQYKGLLITPDGFSTQPANIDIERFPN